ncbi:hypothetical protein [Arthrobacter alkaliphilus]|uniref:hypothetical protein n=1 Tax=Arthrobacter alkaliphilus TaxID=369936 RepID=UPI001F44E592|nr:hypothetical protein [Arthrobacter alkaliphilus]
MDPIRELIEDADPLRRGTGPEPDADQALARVVTGHGHGIDKMPPNVRSLAAARKLRNARIAGLLTIAAAAVAAGVLVASNLGALTTAPVPANSGLATTSPLPTASVSATTTAPPTPTPTPTPTGSVAPLTPWKTFTDATAQATFQLPESWFVVESPRMIAGKPYNSLSVRTADNKQVAALNLVYDRTIGGCAAPRPVTVLDAVDLDISQKPEKVAEFSALKGSALGPSRFTFTVFEGDRVYGSVALSEEKNLPGTAVCQQINGITGPSNVPLVDFGDVWAMSADGSNAPHTFSSVAEARAYMQTQEYQDTKRMLISLSLKQSNVQTSTVFKGSNAKVQFSLPGGWTAKEVKAGTPDFPAWAIDVADESGRKVAQLYYGSGGGLGGACGPDEHYKVTELDTAQSALNGTWTQAAGVRFSYRVLDQSSLGKGLSYEVGLVDKSSGQLVDTCPNLMYAIVTGAPKGSLSFADRATQGPGAPTFATMSEAISYMSTPEYAKLKEMITSLQLTQ